MAMLKGSVAFDTISPVGGAANSFELSQVFSSGNAHSSCVMALFSTAAYFCAMKTIQLSNCAAHSTDFFSIVTCFSDFINVF